MLGNVQVYTPQQTPEGSGVSYTGAIVNTGRHEDGHSCQAAALGDAYLPAVILGGLLYGDKIRLRLTPTGTPLETVNDRAGLSYADGTISCLV